MRCIRWKWLPLVLLLSPVVYLCGWVSANWCLEPKPRYTLEFAAKEQAKVAWPIGAYLRILIRDDKTPPLGHYHRVCRIEDGQFLNNITAGLDKESIKHLSKIAGLPQQPYRYDIFKNDTDESFDYLLSDYETGNFLQFYKQPERGFIDCTLNRPQTHCLMTQDNVFSVVTVPDKRVLASNINNPYLAFRQYHHNAVFIRCLSPSGRWVVVGDDSDRDINTPQERKWTKLHLYDTRTSQWKQPVGSFDGIVHEIAFPTDELLVIMLRESSQPDSRIFLHIPSGKIIDQYSDRMFNKPRICEEATGLSYVKKTEDKQTGHILTSCFIDRNGDMSVIRSKSLNFRVSECFPGCGMQAYYRSVSRRELPEWVPVWLKQGKPHELIRWLLNYNRCEVYDFHSDQILKSWSEAWEGRVSDDGKNLVMNELGIDHNLLRAEVYDLPLPVWSPWWSRGAGIGLVLLLCLLLVRRRGVALLDTPTL